MTRSKQARWARRLLLVWAVGLVGIGSWIAWEFSTYAERRFTEQASSFVEFIDRSDTHLYMRRIDLGRSDTHGPKFPSPPGLVQALERSIKEMRNIKCCDGDAAVTGFEFILVVDGIESQSSVYLLDDGRLMILKESVDFLGALPDVPHGAELDLLESVPVAPSPPELGEGG